MEADTGAAVTIELNLQFLFVTIPHLLYAQLWLGHTQIHLNLLFSSDTTDAFAETCTYMLAAFTAQHIDAHASMRNWARQIGAAKSCHNHVQQRLMSKTQTDLRLFVSNGVSDDLMEAGVGSGGLLAALQQQAIARPDGQGSNLGQGIRPRLKDDQ